MIFDKIRIGVLNEAVRKAPEELLDDILKVISDTDPGECEVQYSRDVYDNVYEISIKIKGCPENKMKELEDKIEEFEYNIIKITSDAGYGVQEINYGTNEITVEIVGCLENGEGIFAFMPRE